MNQVTKHAWKDVKTEELNPLLSRQVLTAKDTMIAKVILKKGCVVPAHHHINEQITYILDGCLRFWIGDHAANPGSEYVDVGPGEVLLIPSNVPHRAEALVDTVDIDVFNPPREDWLKGTDAYLRK
jgi:quercetin dioxygenase-like cupin family protein